MKGRVSERAMRALDQRHSLSLLSFTLHCTPFTVHCSLYTVRTRLCLRLLFLITAFVRFLSLFPIRQASSSHHEEKQESARDAGAAVRSATKGGRLRQWG